MKNMIRKLKSKAGESLVESLAAILIFTMASIIMYSMVMAAGDINTKAKEADEINQQQMLVAEKGEGTSTSGNVTFTLVKPGTTPAETLTSVQVKVDIYGTTDGLYAYYRAP